MNVSLYIYNQMAKATAGPADTTFVDELRTITTASIDRGGRSRPPDRSASARQALCPLLLRPERER
jgi:hypothetical protein